MWLGNPFTDLKQSVSTALNKALEGLCLNTELRGNLESLIEEPPRREFGDLSVPATRLSKLCNASLDELLPRLTESLKALDVVERVEVIGGYVNIFVDYSVFGARVLNSILTSGLKYGVPEGLKSERVVVEYISANPVHPLHVGSGRNAVLGDFLYRLYKFVGNEVQRRYYVNDVGLQSAYLAYGYFKLGLPATPPHMKPDHYLGLIYAATTTIIDIMRLKKALSKAEGSSDLNRLNEIRGELDSLIGDLARIADLIPNEVSVLSERIADDEDPESKVMEILRGYEKGIKDFMFAREVCSKVLEGIRETLNKLNVGMDVWDWESDLVWGSEVDYVVEKALESRYYRLHKGAPALFFDDLTNDPSLRERLKVPKSLEVPPLILRRSDGSTLYTTRDIAYTLKKFREYSADKVINVIAVEQTLSQAQLRLALQALGFSREAENLIHYSYEMVNLPGTSMSGRRGRYVTVDELLNKLVEMVKTIMSERDAEISEDQALKIARSAVKYMILSVSPSKTLVLDLKKALDLKQNSGPYIQYTYVRAKSVLERVGVLPEGGLDLSKANKEPIKTLLFELSKFPEVVAEVLVSGQPEDLVAYVNNLATIFNKFYDVEPIAKEPDEGYRALKVAITYGTSVVLRNFMEIAGMDVLDRM
ncbi:MAG: arginine--tRNA ligase [Zestosphaera sp.]